MNPVEERRLGSFSISADLIRAGDYERVKAVLSGLVIIRAEYLYASGSVEYTAYSELFDPLELGAVIPRYTLLMYADDQGRVINTEWRREL